MKKKTSTLTSSSELAPSCSDSLPIIRKSINRPKGDKCDAIGTIHIISTEDEVFTKLDLEMEDNTHDMLVKWGKEVATDEDYIGIAIRAGLEEFLESQKD